jgi:hypothetical protein
MPNHHEVPRLVKPDLDLAVRQEGNFIVIGLGVPKSSGSVNQSPLLEVTRNEGTTLLNGAKSKFLEKLNGFGIDYKDIDASQSQTTSAGVSAKLPKLGKGEIAVEITSQVSGGVSFRSGKVGDAIGAAQGHYDWQRNEMYNERTKEWAQSTNGITAKNPNTGDTFHVAPQVAKDYYNSWRVWDRVDSGQNNPNATIASVKTNSFEGTDLAKHASQAGEAIKGIVPSDKRDDVVAAVLRNTTDAKFDPKADLSVVQSTKNPDALIPSQGIFRADPVEISKVQQGTAQTVAEAITKPANTQQVAVNVEPDHHQKAPRTQA